MRPDVVQLIQAALDARTDVTLAYVFGSVARGEAGPQSDVDVAVLATTPLGLDGLSRLGEQLARGIDYSGRVDVVDLRDASPVLVAEVVKDGVCIVQRSSEERFDFEMDAIRRYEDTRELRRLQHELLAEAARGHT